MQPAVVRVGGASANAGSYAEETTNYWAGCSGGKLVFNRYLIALGCIEPGPFGPHTLTKRLLHGKPSIGLFLHSQCTVVLLYFCCGRRAPHFV
jgi:hypothetical protein